jgi:hypothetical protein
MPFEHPRHIQVHPVWLTIAASGLLLTHYQILKLAIEEVAQLLDRLVVDACDLLIGNAVKGVGAEANELGEAAEG